MKLFVNSLHFVTKSFSFSLKYQDLVKKIADYSYAKNEYLSINKKRFINPFLDDFFKADSVNCSSKFTVFDGKNIKECLASQFSLFYIKNDLLEEFNSNSLCYTFLLNKAKVEFDSIISEYNLYNDSNIKGENGYPKFKNDFLFNDSSLCFEELLKLDNSKEGALRKFRSAKKKFKDVDNALFKSKDLYPSRYSHFKKCYQSYLFILKFLSIKDLALIKNNDKAKGVVSFIALSKTGIAQIGFFGSAYTEVYNGNSYYNSIRKAKNASSIICKRTSPLLNCLFVVDALLKSNEKLSLYNWFFEQKNEPARKAVYLNFIYDKEDSLPLSQFNGNIKIKKIFDFITSSVSFEHTFHDKYLWEYDMKKPCCHFDKKIIDYGNGETEHFYYDDNLFVLSIINPLYCYSEDYKLSSSLLVPELSHQSKIYSLRKFMNICEAMVFGSIGVFAFKAFERCCTYKMEKSRKCLKLRRMYLFHRLLFIGSDLLKIFNTTSFAAKNDSMSITKIVFDNIKLIELISSSIDLLDNGWKDGNLLTSQSYNRYSLFLSIGSLSVSLFSFGMISKIYVDGYYISSSNSMRQPSSDWFGLLLDAFKTPKMWLVTFICFLPFFIFLLLEVVESCKNRHFILMKEYNKSFPERGKK